MAWWGIFFARRTATCSTSPSVRSADYYVSAAGDDGLDGTAADRSWRTIARAGRHAFSPGDRLLFRGGDEFVGNLLLNVTGSPAADKPVILGSFGTGRAIVQAGNGTGVRITDVGGVVVRDLIAIGNDRRALNQQLIDSAARVRGMEEQVAAAQERLKPLDLREQGLRKSLAERRGVMAEVLAALQRIGTHPPPAMMVAPEDALQSLRSAMLLGAVLPAMRHDADLLIADLIELTRVREEIAAQRDALNRDLVAQEQERQRLALLTDQRQKQEAEDEKTLGQERQHLSELARSADSLKDLMAKLEQSLPPAARAARACPQAPPAAPPRASRPRSDPRSTGRRSPGSRGLQRIPRQTPPTRARSLPGPGVL